MAADDDDFLDDVFDRALAALTDGRRVDVEAMSTSRPELRAQVEATVRLALEVAAPRAPGFPAVPGYQLVAELGRGGMGAVFLARQERLGGRLVALKVLPSGEALTERGRARFLDEAKALARLRHEHVVTVHDVVEAPGLCAYAMEWVEGQSLASLLDAARSLGGEDGAQSREVFFCRIALQVARALGAVHDAGLMHRDVKPSNVLVREDGRAVLIDFGLARATDATITAGFAGTLAYAAPEQLAGKSEDVGPRGDVYGLGATLYHALAQRPAFDGSSPATLARAIEAGTPSLRRWNPRVSRDLDTIVATAMAADPARRYPTAHAFAEDFERLLSLQPIHARPAGLATRLAMLVQRNRRAVAGAVAGGVLALLLAALAISYALHRAGIPSRVRAHVEAARLSLLSAEHGERLFIALHLPDHPRSNALEAGAIARALVEYDAALALAPHDGALRAERETVAYARDGEAAGDPSDRHALGLVAYLRGDAEPCSRAWEGLDLADPGDPLVDAALGELHLQREQPALAYPRLEAAARAFPRSGFVRVQLAAAALRCGDVERAGRLLEETKELSGHDRFDSRTAVRAEWHAARGEVTEARRLFEWMRTKHKTPAVRARYARLLATEGEHVAALIVLGEAIALHPGAVAFRQQQVALVERWWEGLDYPTRRRWLTELAATGEKSWLLNVLRGYADSVVQLAGLAPPAPSPSMTEESAIATGAVASSAAVRQSLLALVSAGGFAVTFARTPTDPPFLRELQLSAWMSRAPALASRAVAKLRRLHDAARWLLGAALLTAPTPCLAQGEWLLQSPTAHPSARGYSAMSYDAARARVVLFGGNRFAPSLTLFGDTWEWDGSQWTERTPAHSPTARTSETMAYDVARQRTVLFGGWDGTNDLDDTWEWDGVDWVASTPAHRPPARDAHRMAYDSVRGCIVLFGGSTIASTRLNDTWEWDGTDWTERVSVVSPSPRYRPALWFDANRGRVVLFGGFTDTGYADDMWEWDGTIWASVPVATRPTARGYANVGYDEDRQRVVLFGGVSGSVFTPLADTWEWNGSSWHAMPSGTSPAGRYSAAMAHHRATGRGLLFGGFANPSSVTDDTWTYRRAVDADQSMVIAAPSLVSGFGGTSTIAVTPRDASGSVVGAGLAVIVSTTSGSLLGSITDNGDGTYAQILQAIPTAAGAVVSATVNSVAITDTASVTFIPIDPAQSTITVSPDTTFLGGHATVTVTPKNDQGVAVGSGKTVVLQTTLGTLTGSVSDNNDGTYTQRLDATALGTASITATADGLALTPSASLTVLDSTLGRVIGVRVDNTAFPYDTIQQAVNRAQLDQLARILVNPGTYDELVTLRGKHDISLEGLSSAGLVTVRGFRISQSHDLSFAFFDIDASSNARHGVELLGGHHSNERIAVDNCTVHSTTDNFDGIRIDRDNCDVVLRNLWLEANAGDGVSLGDGPCGVTVTDVTILASGRNGVRSTDAATVRIERCRVENSGTRLDDRQGYAIFRQRRAHGATPQTITLVGNTFAGNRGRVIAGKSDANLGNYDQILDGSDSQAGY